MNRIYLVVRTSYDVFVKPTYALLKKERTDILRLIVRSFFVKLAPVLNIYGAPIPVVEEAKYLVLLFDKKLTFIPHIKALKAKCLKALNVLKVLSNTNWGGDRSLLLNLYRSLVRSKLDYDSVVYVLKMS